MADTAAAQIQEMPDLTDSIDVLESIIEELQVPKLGKGELEIVNVI